MGQSDSLREVGSGLSYPCAMHRVVGTSGNPRICSNRRLDDYFRKLSALPVVMGLSS